MTLFQKFPDGICFQRRNETVRLTAFGRDGLRLQATCNADFQDRPHALLDPAAPPAGALQIKVTETGARIVNGQIVAEVSGEGQIRYARTADNETLLQEVQTHILKPSARRYRSRGADSWQVQCLFEPDEGERFYGLGQHRHGRLDQKGCVLELRQANCEVSIPFVVSSKRYGFLWNNPAVGRVELARNGTRWLAEQCKQIDYYITAGRSYEEIMARYADATGHAPMLPEFASGFWQSRLRYRTQAELLEVAREYKRRELPLSVIVIDFFHWTLMGDWKFDPACWPDPDAMVAELKDMGVEVMVSVWPSVNPASENFQEMFERGLLAQAERGEPVFMAFMDNDSPELGSKQLYFIDPTRPETRRFVWDRCRQNYYDKGIRVFWLDCCEPQMPTADHDNVRFQAGSALELGCLYPREVERAFYEGLVEAGEDDIITLCRSAWAGSQRYAAAVWSGDIESTFDVLAGQVRAGLNIGLSGIPWWTTDIGGFLDGDPTDPTMRELIVRWFQYGVFCPLFRLHGNREPSDGRSGAPNEVWSYGEQAYPILAEQLRLRERIRPYVMEQMRRAHEHGTPPMRPLFYDFPADETAYEVEDQFLLGPDVLVAPVTVEGARQRRVYLPEGTDWTDPASGETHTGGQWIDAAAPLERIPVFCRAGAEVPIQP